jgi:hypothetical protein
VGYNAISMVGWRHSWVSDVVVVDVESGVLLSDVSAVTISGLTLGNTQLRP